MICNFSSFSFKFNLNNYPESACRKISPKMIWESVAVLKSVIFNHFQLKYPESLNWWKFKLSESNFQHLCIWFILNWKSEILIKKKFIRTNIHTWANSIYWVTHVFYLWSLILRQINIIKMHGEKFSSEFNLQIIIGTGKLYNPEAENEKYMSSFSFIDFRIFLAKDLFQSKT